MEAIVEARAGGRAASRSLYDFCERVDLGAVNRRMIESLIKAGAMDSLEGTRAQKFAAVEGRMEAGQRAWRDRAERAGRTVRRDSLAARAPHEPSRCPTSPTGPQKEKLTGEKEMLGFYVTGHPLDEFRGKVTEAATHTTGSLGGRRERGAR